MIAYLDASVLVSFIVGDSETLRAQRYISGLTSAIVSDFGRAEFASAIARRVRMGEHSPDDGKRFLQILDNWIETEIEVANVQSDDIRRADAYLRRLDLNLRTPDAIHIAIAMRFDVPLATLDERMAGCARAPSGRKSANCKSQNPSFQPTEAFSRVPLRNTFPMPSPGLPSHKPAPGLTRTVACPPGTPGIGTGTGSASPLGSGSLGARGSASSRST